MSDDGTSKEIGAAWSDVGERLTAWGRLVSARYHDAGREPTSTETAAGMPRGSERATRDLGDQLNRAFTAIGDTLRDDRAKEQLRDAMKAVGDAIGVTVEETTDAIRRRVGRDEQQRDPWEDRGDDAIPPPPPA